MKKYLALALIAALAAFAAPSFADKTGDNNNYIVNSDNGGYTWTSDDNSQEINSLSISDGATLTMIDKAEVNGANATISGSGTLKGDDVNDLYGISSVNGITIDAAQTEGRSTNMQLAAATKGQSSGSVSLTMMGVKANPGLDSNEKLYLKVAPQFVRNDAKPETSELESARITVTDSAIGHSLFGGPLAISGNEHNLTITNSEIVINGTSQIGRAIYAGGGVWGTDNKTHVENAKITVNGGSFGSPALSNKPTENGMIYGGGLVENDNTEGSSSTVGNVEIIINGGSVEGVRGGGRIDTETTHDANVTKVDNVSIVIDGAATIGERGVTAGSEKVTRGADENHSIVADSVADASVVIKNVPAGATFKAPISGEGCVEEAADIELQNVKGTIDSIAKFGNVGVDPNTSATINKLSDEPALQLVGDWRDESGVREINLDDLVKVQDKAIEDVFSLDEEGKPYYDTEETGITSLEANPDGTFTATVERPARQHSGGGGGCSAGFGALALLAALPLIRMRKK